MDLVRLTVLIDLSCTMVLQDSVSLLCDVAGERLGSFHTVDG